MLVPDAGHQALMERPDLVNPPLLRLVRDALTVLGTSHDRAADRRQTPRRSDAGWPASCAPAT